MRNRVSLHFKHTKKFGGKTARLKTTLIFPENPAQERSSELSNPSPASCNKTPLRQSMIMMNQLQALPPEIFTMEYEAEFAEDQDAYFSQELIRSCLAPEAEYAQESDLVPT